MQADLTPALALFCGAPLILFWAGFFAGRWSSRVRIIRVDQASAAINDTRLTRAGASAPAPIKQIMRAKGEQER